ncbi:MAG: PP2C family protein-serine/threonine phosphatase [Bacteroidia bacterium]
MDYLVEEVTYKELHTEYSKLYNTNKQLTDNIYYAAFVQQGIFPQERHLKRLFDEYFVIYKPRNIIGGDLYWVCQKGDLKIFAVADCTGHGVSGALLSVLAVSFLNYLVLGKDFNSLGEVLEELDKKWIEAFQQGAELGYNNDWMEIGICAFNSKTRELHYAGAFNDLLIVSEKEMNFFSGDRYPIGGWQMEEKRTFTDHKIFLPENSMLYLFSDGYKDQFGDLSQKRYSSKRFYNLLKSVSEMTSNKQLEKLESEWNFWKGEETQTDDVCVMGVRL